MVSTTAACPPPGNQVGVGKGSAECENTVRDLGGGQFWPRDAANTARTNGQTRLQKRPIGRCMGPIQGACASGGGGRTGN
jgi:hypothetical protein